MLPARLIDNKTKVFINPKGGSCSADRWRLRSHGPQDHRRHLRRSRPPGGGAFSGQRPSKVDARAVHGALRGEDIVARGLGRNAAWYRSLTPSASRKPVSLLVENVRHGYGPEESWSVPFANFSA